MGGLAHYLEGEGIPTTQISLIRKHTEGIRPPRALAVPFELGRPFGAPNEPDFQRRVLKNVLDLLERNDGPILDDFPDQAPGGEVDMEGWTCPVNLSPPAGDMSDSEKLATDLKTEIGLLRPWYDESVKAGNGRRLDGLTEFSAEEIGEAIIKYIDDGNDESPMDEYPSAKALKIMHDDLKHFYYQAALARPGNISDLQIANWYFGETLAGKLVLMLREFLKDVEDPPALKHLGMMALVPNTQAHRSPNE